MRAHVFSDEENVAICGSGLGRDILAVKLRPLDLVWVGVLGDDLLV